MVIHCLFCISTVFASEDAGVSPVKERYELCSQQTLHVQNLYQHVLMWKRHSSVFYSVETKRLHKTKLLMLKF